MRLLCVCAGLASLLLATPASVYAQRMLEHALTAAGGSASGAASKGVSEGLDAIFGKLKAQSDRAAKAHLSKRLKPEEIGPAEVAPSGSQFEGAIQALPAGPRAARGAQVHRQAPSHRREQWNTPAPEVVQHRTSLEALEAVEAGTSRRDLVSRLGTPSARVMIPEHGELREVYHFSSGRTHVGRVTLSNGTVANVEIDPRAR